MPLPSHRRRSSALRLSSDTTHSLPVYAAADDDDDRPPDYPDSAEEADRDTDSDSPPPPPSFSPQRRRLMSPTHRRRPSGKNPHLHSSSADPPTIDSLLARSVHALEVSNTLLKSSMATQSALKAVLAVDDPPARRIDRRGEEQPKWADDLAEINRDVDGLFASCSLPTSSSPIKKRRRPSASASSLSLPLHAPLSSPKITETLLEPATPAYTMLSSFVSPRRDRASISPPSSFKGKQHDRSPGTLTPKQHRPMTPPAEEESSSSSSPGSSSDTGCLAKRTVLSLRKILDEQPPSPAPAPKAPRRLRAPAFLPRTPAPVAKASTSTATASISRLYTKSKHTSSTRPPSPPRQSAMKQRTDTDTQAVPAVDEDADAKAFHFPPRGLLGVRNWSTASLRSLGARSAPSSGCETPRRISFAELPESYKGSGSGSARFGRERKKRRGRGRGDEAEGGGWWGTWFLGGGGGGGGGPGGREERIEERFGRSWGGRIPGASAGFGPAVDEWPI